MRTITFRGRRDVEREMALIGVDPAGISLMRDKAIGQVIKLEGVSSPAANILKQEMLSLGGDAAVAKGVVSCQVDRSDVLLLGNRSQIRRLAGKVRGQPFGLSEVARRLAAHLEMEESLPSFEITCGGKTLKLGSRTHIMGILNVTPDSFSDGGKFFELDRAVRQAERMASEGADIIDVGGESSRPGSDPVSLDEEIRRVVPVVESIARRFDIPISIDTYKSEVAHRALDVGAAIVNDISALRFDERMGGIVAEYNVPVILMHLKGTPKNMQKDPSYHDLMGEIWTFLNERIEAAVGAGVKRDRIIVDPGIGFGKTAGHNLKIIARLGELRSLGCPILIGPSRKSFIGAVLDLPVDERLEGTLSAAALAIANGAHIIRAHDVKEMVRAARMADAVGGWEQAI